MPFPTISEGCFNKNALVSCLFYPSVGFLGKLQYKQGVNKKRKDVA